MNPNQCGTGRDLATLHPADRRAIVEFGEWLATGAVHIKAVRHIMTGATRPQLIAAPPYHVDDFVKVTDETDPNVGRWGIVVDVIDYRDGDVPLGDRLEFLVMVSLKTTRPGVGVVEHPPGPVPFEPCELAPLFGGPYRNGGGPGDYVKSGRVVSDKHWPAARTGLTDAS